MIRMLRQSMVIFLALEVMSLAGWLVAYCAAVRFAPEAARPVPVGVPGSGLNHSAALALRGLSLIGSGVTRF